MFGYELFHFLSKELTGSRSADSRQRYRQGAGHGPDRKSEQGNQGNKNMSMRDMKDSENGGKLTNRAKAGLDVTLAVRYESNSDSLCIP